MSSSAPAVHPVLGALAVVEGALKDVAGVNPTFMDPDVQGLALSGLAVAEARLAELRLRVMAASVGVVETDAAKDIAAWLVAHARVDIRIARADARLRDRPRRAGRERGGPPTPQRRRPIHQAAVRGL